MSRRARGLLAEIERDALNERTSIASLLRKCVVLGGRAESAELRDWAQRELNGYHGKGDVPEYRIVPAPLCADGSNMRYRVKGLQISPFQLPEFAREEIKEVVHFTQGIGELEELARTSKEHVDLGPPGASDLVTYINARQAGSGLHVESLYWRVSMTQVHGILQHVRNVLVGLIAELLATTPGDQDIPSAEATDQAINVILRGGKRHRVNVTVAQSGSGAASATPAAPAEESWWIRWRKRGIVVGLSTMAAAALAAFTWLEWKPWE